MPKDISVFPRFHIFSMDFQGAHSHARSRTILDPAGPQEKIAIVLLPLPIGTGTWQ